MKKALVLFTSLLVYLMTAACSQNHESHSSELEAATQNLYSKKAMERQVSFSALYQSGYTDLASFQADPSAVSIWDVSRTVKFLFGPLVYRELGGPQRGEKISLHPEQAVLQNGYVMVPYDYSATWLISRDFPGNQMILPLPYQSDMQQTPKWVNCGDSAPEHQDAGFFWYFWDPSRPQCDQVLGVHYQNVNLNFGNETVQTTESYPEYSRLIQTRNGEKILQMTFAFGYVEDQDDPHPFQDFDPGMSSFQTFTKRTEKTLTALGFQKSPIQQSEYDGADDLTIGTRFTGMKNGVKVIVSIVSNAGVDQMNLFAESYAARQEGFFGWFGHSRVGSGFDAQSFQMIMNSNPERYSLTSDYQLIYWAGCNSYNYYTLPFFEMKARLNPTQDPKGTKNLDIISNGLPTYFSLNAYNADIMLKALLNWDTPTSFQSIVDQIEDRAEKSGGTTVLVNVLGDEDNQ